MNTLYLSLLKIIKSKVGDNHTKNPSPYQTAYLLPLRMHQMINSLLRKPSYKSKPIKKRSKNPKNPHFQIKELYYDYYLLMGEGSKKEDL